MPSPKKLSHLVLQTNRRDQMIGRKVALSPGLKSGPGIPLEKLQRAALLGEVFD